MTVRPVTSEDLLTLRKWHEASGFAYEFPANLESFESVAVVVDEHGQPVMACGAEKILQLYLWSSEFEHPAAKLGAVRLLHQALRSDLKDKGYHEANCFLPPEVEKQFGGRLMRTFGWVKNWASYCIRF